MNRLKKWLSEHKDKPAFKHTVIIAVLIILAIAAQLFDNWRDSWDDTESAPEIVTEEKDEKNTVAEIIDNSKGHVIMLVITGTALAVVQYKKKHKIKESK